MKSLDLEPVLDDATNENLFLEELNNGFLRRMVLRARQKEHI